jgi:hypothetical protein
MSRWALPELPLDDWQRDPFVGHLLEAFFIERLMTQRQASSHTIAGYRDTMRLLLTFASQQTGKPPSRRALPHVAQQPDPRPRAHTPPR